LAQCGILVNHNVHFVIINDRIYGKNRGFLGCMRDCLSLLPRYLFHIQIRNLTDFKKCKSQYAVSGHGAELQISQWQIHTLLNLKLLCIS